MYRLSCHRRHHSLGQLRAIRRYRSKTIQYLVALLEVKIEKVEHRSIFITSFSFQAASSSVCPSASLAALSTDDIRTRIVSNMGVLQAKCQLSEEDRSLISPSTRITYEERIRRLKKKLPSDSIVELPSPLVSSIDARRFVSYGERIERLKNKQVMVFAAEPEPVATTKIPRTFERYKTRMKRLFPPEELNSMEAALLLEPERRQTHVGSSVARIGDLCEPCRENFSTRMDAAIGSRCVACLAADSMKERSNQVVSELEKAKAELKDAENALREQVRLNADLIKSQATILAAFQAEHARRMELENEGDTSSIAPVNIKMEILDEVPQ